MKINKVIFYFDKWKFIFKYKDKIFKGHRFYSRYNVKVISESKEYNWLVTAFVPSAKICRSLKKLITKK